MTSENIDSSAAPQPVRTIHANGLRFAYLEEGAGPLVLLLHGFPDAPHTWDDLRPRLAAKGYRAVSPFTAATTRLTSRPATPTARRSLATRSR